MTLPFEQCECLRCMAVREEGFDNVPLAPDVLLALLDSTDQLEALSKAATETDRQFEGVSREAWSLMDPKASEPTYPPLALAHADLKTLRAELAAVTAERDRLREDMGHAKSAIAQTMRERNEARAQLAAAEAHASTQTGIIGDYFDRVVAMEAREADAKKVYEWVASVIDEEHAARFGKGCAPATIDDVHRLVNAPQPVSDASSSAPPAKGECDSYCDTVRDAGQVCEHDKVKP